MLLEWQNQFYEDCKDLTNYRASKMRHVRMLHCVWLFVTHGLYSPGSAVHGISQEKILEWVALSFSGGSSQSRDQTHISCLAGGFFTTEYTVGNTLNLYLIENFVPFKLVANRN